MEEAAFLIPSCVIINPSVCGLMVWQGKKQRGYRGLFLTLPLKKIMWLNQQEMCISPPGIGSKKITFPVKASEKARKV